MNIDLIVIEVGSTITKVNAFNKIGSDKPVHIGQGIDLTTVDSDVNIGVNKAIENLKSNLGCTKIEWGEILANSSAAGGLRMVATGLTMEMTARAAKEAALGAGAILYYLTAGSLSSTDLRKIVEAKPNIILFAGGVDYGEQEIILENAKKLASLNLNIPLIYAGNRVLEDEIRDIFSNTNFILEIVPNVYPSIDEFNIEPTRKKIQEIFSRHIIHAKGIDKLQDLVKKDIIPTPYAVLKICEILYEEIGDLVCFDVGGATTDVHSVTEGSEKYRSLLIAPEPFSKRTVEGDLGVYVNASNVNKFLQEENQSLDLQYLKPLPGTNEEFYISYKLTEKAVKTSLERHAGKIIEIYTVSGKKLYISGKDLTAVNYIIGTGGALTRLKGSVKILEDIRIPEVYKKLFPLQKAKVLLDKKYVFSSCGCIGMFYKDVAKKIALSSLFE
ncbi:MAG: glutamate mutase L [Spirochaetes bacterium]|nr:glutamate mutase L [Spirochaetota bacterium]